MKIADYYKEINNYYVNLNKALAQEREERECREMEDGPVEAYHEELDTNHEQDNVDAELDATIRELDEEDENHEDDDDFFAGLYDNV